MVGRRAFAILVGAVVLAAGAATAQAKRGDVYVGESGNETIVRVSAATGDQNLISDDSDFEGPSGLDFTSRGVLYVADYSAPGIFRVNIKTGAARPVKVGAPFDESIDVEVRGKWLYVADAFARGGTGAIFRVSRRNGRTRVLADHGFFGGGPMALTFHDGFIWVADQGGFVVRVDPDSGRQKLIASAEDEPELGGPRGIAWSKDTLFVTDGDDAIVRVRPKTGKANVVVEDSVDADSLYEIAANAAGRLYGASSGNASIVLADPLAATIEPFATDNLLSGPEGVTVQPRFRRR